VRRLQRNQIIYLIWNSACKTIKNLHSRGRYIGTKQKQTCKLLGTLGTWPMPQPITIVDSFIECLN
jgi:hypothetical protein